MRVFDNLTVVYFFGPPGHPCMLMIEFGL